MRVLANCKIRSARARTVLDSLGRGRGTSPRIKRRAAIERSVFESPRISVRAVRVSSRERRRARYGSVGAIDRAYIWSEAKTRDAPSRIHNVLLPDAFMYMYIILYIYIYKILYTCIYYVRGVLLYALIFYIALSRSIERHDCNWD